MSVCTVETLEFINTTVCNPCRDVSVIMMTLDRKHICYVFRTKAIARVWSSGAARHTSHSLCGHPPPVSYAIQYGVNAHSLRSQDIQDQGGCSQFWEYWRQRRARNTRAASVFLSSYLPPLPAEAEAAKVDFTEPFWTAQAARSLLWYRVVPERDWVRKQQEVFFISCCNLPIPFTSKWSNQGNGIRKVKKWRKPAGWKANEQTSAAPQMDSYLQHLGNQWGSLNILGVSREMERPQ